MRLDAECVPCISVCVYERGVVRMALGKMCVRDARVWTCVRSVKTVGCVRLWICALV